MSQDKFWLQFNNGKKEQLKDLKHGIRKEQVDSKYHNLFDGYDTNNDGTLEENELQNLKDHFKNFAGDDTLDSSENLKAQSIFEEKVNFKDVDFSGFMKSLSDAVNDIISTKEKNTRDGGKEITTEYKDGTVETIALYKNGDFKWKKVNKNLQETFYEIEINGQTKQITKEEFEQAKEKLNKGGVKVTKGSEGQTQFSISGVSNDNVKISSTTNKREVHLELYSPRYIAESLNIDTQTEEGIKIIQRLSMLSPETLAIIKDGAEIKELLSQNDLSPSFDNISNILEIIYGITIRDKEELEESKQEREQLIAQIQAVEIMSTLYATVAQFNDSYTDSQGLFGLGSEGIGYLLNKFGIDGENHYQWADSCREFIEKINGFKVLNPEKFNKEFKELTGTDSFNLSALQKMLDLAKNNKAQSEDGNYTEEYKEAVKAFSNFDITNPNAKAWYHPLNLLNGFGEAMIMIGTLGWGAETQGGKMLAASTMSFFSRLGVQVASNQARKKVFQGALRWTGQGVKLIGPALNEGTKLYLYSALTGTATNLANRGIKYNSEEDTLDRLLATEGIVLDGATSSFGFGAFAGVFGATVTQRVMQTVSRTSQKVGTALADKFAKGAVKASDAYITILEKSAPTKVAEAVAFATDVLGFTGFESALALYHACNDSGKYPDGISIEEFSDILWEEFKGQGVNLGQIKGISYLVMWMSGSRSARIQAAQYMRDNIPALKGTTIEKLENKYKIKLPNGKYIECKNEKEMISSLHLMVREETAFSKKFNPGLVTVETEVTQQRESNSTKSTVTDALQEKKQVKFSSGTKESPITDEAKANIPPEMVQKLIEKANGNQNIIKNIQKLVEAGASYGVCADIIHRLDIPEEIIDTYIRKFKETGCDISYQIFILINNLQNSTGLKDNYKEIFDYSLELFEKTSNGKKLTATQVADLIRYSCNDKSAIDLMLEYMNIDELGEKQLKPQDIEVLLPYIKENHQARENIIRIAKLTPEQLSDRNNKPIDGNLIKQILKIENLTDEQLEIIKSILCDKNLQKAEIKDYAKIDGALILGFDEYLLDLFKELITTDLNAKGLFGKKTLFYGSVCNIVKNYPTKEDIVTIKQLFELHACDKNGQLLNESHFTKESISKEELAKMRAYMEAVKDNPSLMNNLSFKIVNDENRVQKILQMLKDDPNLTYDKVVTEVDILPKIKHIKHKELYDLAFEVEKRGLVKDAALIQEISYKIEGVEDEYINGAIKTLLAELNDYIKKGSNQNDFILPLIDEWLDVYHTLKGDYEYIGTKEDPTFKRALYEFAKEHEPHRAEELDRAIQEGIFDTDNFEWERIMPDFVKEAGIDRLRNYFKNHPHEEIGEGMYLMYYLPTLPPEIQEKCKNILTQYKTNIFLNADDVEFTSLVLDFVEAEFKEWKEKSNGTAVFPPVLDFSKAKRSYIDSESTYGKGTLSGFAENETNNSISIDGIETAMYALRHEMTHLNDTKKGRAIDIQYNINEIMPKMTDKNGNERIDFENCKYREEFLKAGIPLGNIEDAYTNMEEFIAVASEGDMTKYSPEFKRILINFGLPEWVLNMKVQHPTIEDNAKKASFILDLAKKNDILVNGEKIDISKDFDILSEMLREINRCEVLCREALGRQSNLKNTFKLYEYCFTREDKETIYNDPNRIKDILLQKTDDNKIVQDKDESSDVEETSKEDAEEYDDYDEEEALKNSEKTAQQYYELLERVDNPQIKAIIEKRVKKFVDLHAPHFIVANEQSLAMRYIDKYNSIIQEIQNIPDENLRNEMFSRWEKIIQDEDNHTSLGKCLNIMNGVLNIKARSASQRFMNFIKEFRPDIYKELEKSPENIDNPRYREIKLEFEKIDKTESIIQECITLPDSPRTEELYERYLEEEPISDNPKIAEQIRKICRQINKDLGVKVFLPSNLKEAGVALKITYEELMSFKMHAEAHGEKANFPRVLNFLRAKSDYISDSYEDSHTIGQYNYDLKYMGVDGLTINRVRDVILHEMTHANDLKILKEFPEDFQPELYMSEFLAAGIPAGHVNYALKNPRDFISVAAEGDIRKYTDYFKEKLVELGMPAWMLDMQNPTAERKIIKDPVKQLFAELMIMGEYEKDQKLKQEQEEFESEIFEDFNTESAENILANNTLETLLKIKEETDKLIEELDRKHERNRLSIHSWEEICAESDSYFKIRNAYREYKGAIDTAILLAQRIEYEKTVSKVEKEFKTIEKENAINIIKDALKAVKQYEWYVDNFISACTIEDKISEELVNKCIELIAKDSTDMYKIQNFLELFKTKTGIDRASIETFEELSKGKYSGKDGALTKLLEACKDYDSKFRYDRYERAKQLVDDEKGNHNWIKEVFRNCEILHTTPDYKHSLRDIDENIWAKALELKEMGFGTYDICKLIEFCRNTINTDWKASGDFVPEQFELIKELKDKYKVDIGEISAILTNCVTKKGEFNRAEYDAAIALIGHVKEEDIASFSDILARIEDKDAALKHIDELQQEYKCESRRVMFVYKVCCDEIKDADGNTTYKFNPTKYEKAVELKPKYNVDDFDLQHYIRTCTINGKFEEKIYNKIVEYKTKYGFEDEILNQIIGQCIHPKEGEQSWEATDIDYKLMDKIGVWTDLYLKADDEAAKLLQLEPKHDYNEIGRNIINILEKIESPDCEAIDYVEKFIEAGMIKIHSRLREAMVLDENGYCTNPPHYNPKVMQTMIDWANKYHLEDEQFQQVMWRINTQTELTKEEAMKCITQLYEAGWEAKNTDSFRAIIKRWGHDNNCDFDIDAINLFTEYLKKGFSANVIETAVFNCAKSGEPHTDEYYIVDKEKLDRTLEMVRYCPGDYKEEAARWMYHFSDYYKPIVTILDEHHFKIPFKDFYSFAWNNLCNADVMYDPQKKARIPQILEQIALHPEHYEDIKEIWNDRKFPHNDKYFNFCFKHLKDRDWKTCFTQYHEYANFRLILDIIDILDNDKMPLVSEMSKNWVKVKSSPFPQNEDPHNISRYAYAICAQIGRYNGDGINKGQYCPEVIEKVKELMINGELSSIIRTPEKSTIVFDNPEFCKVLDALAKAEREGFDKDLITLAFYRIRGGNNVRDNHFATNYQEIIDFYVRNEDILGVNTPGKTFEEQSKNIQIDNLLSNIQTEDVELLEKTIKYAQYFDNPSIISDLSRLLYKKANPQNFDINIDIKPIIDFLDKVDFEKYGKEAVSLLTQMTGGYAIWNNGNFKFRDLLFSDKLSKENLEIILDTEKFLNENCDAPEQKTEHGYLQMPSNYRPQLTNEFYKIFLDGEVPEEALNKFRFYLEYQASIVKDENDIPFQVVDTGKMHHASTIDLDGIVRLLQIYKLSPDRIEFFEKYLFSGDSEQESFIDMITRSLSKDKTIMDKQFGLLDDLLSYDNAISSKHRIHDILDSSSPDNIDARIEVWNQIKPKKKKAGNGELADKLYFLLSVNDFNKDILMTAYEQCHYEFNDLNKLASYLRPVNKKLILELINEQNYAPDIVIQIAKRTQHQYLVDFAKLLLKDGTFTKGQIENILYYTPENRVPLVNELCFNKENNFSKDEIANVLSYCNDINEPLAWKLCTSKVRQIPEDKIPLALKCYHNKEINMDMYINKFKMFLDLEFSDVFITNILGTSGSLARYTKNFCTVLQHLKEKGMEAEKCVELLTTDAISDYITKNIEILEVLNSIEGDDIKLLQADGIDIYSKIQKLQKAIDIKHPIIGVKKGDEIGTLKALANNGNADKIIQTMDLTQFDDKSGIPLEYTREEFINNMNRLITEYTSGESDKLRGFASVERKEIPDLELSEEAQEKVRQKIEEFKQKYLCSPNDKDIILDGKTCHAMQFRGSKTSGSNPGDFYLIDGKLYYVKTPNSDKLGQSVEEVIASRLYRAAGIDAPNEHYIFNEKGEVIGMASEYVPDMEPRSWGCVKEEEAKLMFESFAVDAWLANWDAPKNDNTQIYDNGKIIKSDVGGSMHYRARGEIKENFNGIVIELLTLIENNSILYSKMTKQDVLNSIKRVLDIPDATIFQTIMEAPSHDAKLAETMIRRKAYLQKFYENLENLSDNGQNVVDLIIEAQGKTVTEFKEIPDIAGSFGYIPTENGFEGLLNTKGSDKLHLTPEQQVTADKIKAEIERFTVHNRVADNAKVSKEVRDFINGILKGVPEFASYFGKPQHGGHQYSLDLHILNVLQKSLQNPLYEAVDEYGFKLLDYESKIVLKFSTLLHDIGKMHMSGKDEGHAERSAEYVYSILDRFNLPTRVKNRIINIVNNHHWFEQLCTNAIKEEQVAATFRTTADFTIARIMAQADLESVHDGYFTSRMSRNFPSEVSNEQSAYKKFNAIMDGIQKKVNQIEETSSAISPSKFVEVPEHIGPDGEIVPRRGFPIVEIELDGKVEQFRVLNLNDLDPDTDMYQFGFNHIKLKDLKLLVHRFGDGEWGKFTTTKLLGDNPTRFSVQSLSLISPKHASAYCGRNFSCIMEGNNANIGVAYYRNAGTGSWKNLSHLTEEFFSSHFEKKRTFFKKEFIQFLEEKRGVKISDREYGTIMRYIRNKQYVETQLHDLNLGNKTIKRDDLVDGILFAQQRLIDKQKDDNDERHNEVTEIDCHIIAGGGSLNTVDELKEKKEFLRLCRDNCNGTIILW